MGRNPRVFVDGLSLHIMQRGHNRNPVFHDAADCEMFLGLLRRMTESHYVDLHAFAVMTNHYHLLATPRRPYALARAMKELNGSYTRQSNRRYQRMGTVWNGRYKALLIEDARYWLTCLRYIEQNPVRAGIVSAAEHYRWSSYSAHAFGRWEPWLTPHAVYTQLGPTGRERETAYRQLCGQPIPEEHLALLRSGVRPGSDGCQTGV